MDRRFTALAGILGFTWWRSRKKRAVLTPPPPVQPDPADELRAKLAEARDADDRDEFESGGKPVDAAVSVADDVADARPEDRAAEGGPGASDVESKRRDAHERARTAIDDLRSE
ncbi:MAG TPA: hypothetical protein VIK66_07385 [Gaiellaceae bacterium]